MAMEIRDRAVLITGASRGLGGALAKALAAEGAKVALVARGEAALEEVVGAIRARGGVAHAIVGDVGDKLSVHRIAATAAAVIGPVDVVVHNASTLGKTPLELLLDTDCEVLSATLETNVVGPFRLTKALAGSMVLRERGVIVHVSSDAAIAAYPRWGAYGVSKAALDHLARIWAAELEGTGVRFVSIDPGEMDTTMHAEAMPDADRSTLARPDVVAASIVTTLRRIESVKSGARVDAAGKELA
jgi:NAD(P)-dependent dehydrogenase (short-subunit alcohol dehydrogenase family)